MKKNDVFLDFTILIQTVRVILFAQEAADCGFAYRARSGISARPTNRPCRQRR